MSEEMPKPDETILAREVKREQELEQAWDKVCGEEAVVEFNDPIFGKSQVSAFCLGDKHHPAGAHLFTIRSWHTPAENLTDSLSMYERRPF
jgi:hypothetical protein